MLVLDPGAVMLSIAFLSMFPAIGGWLQNKPYEPQVELETMKFWRGVFFTMWIVIIVIAIWWIIVHIRIGVV